MVKVIFQIIVMGLVFWLLWWLIGYVGLPEPFKKIALVILAILAVFFLINLLLSLTGRPIVRMSQFEELRFPQSSMPAPEIT